MNNEYLKFSSFSVLLRILLLFCIIYFIFLSIALANKDAFNKKIKNKDYREKYFSLVVALENNSIDVPQAYKDKIVKYLEKHTQAIIDLNIDGANRAWFIVEFFFIRTDLIYAYFEDGHMYGGEILLKVNFKGSEIISIERLWERY